MKVMKDQQVSLQMILHLVMFRMCVYVQRQHDCEKILVVFDLFSDKVCVL